MFETAVSLLSMWGSMNTWLTPTVLFLFLNIMIGTIAITSGFTTTHHHHHRDNHHHQQQTLLARSPSVLQRLKSLSLYPYLHYPPPPSTHHQPPPPPPYTAVSNPETETHHSTPPPEKNPETESQETAAAAAEEGPTLDEVYNLIVQKGNNSIHYGRQHSDTNPDSGVAPVPLPWKMKKIASDKSASIHFEVAVLAEERENVGGDGGDVEVDARADDFITKFRQRLKLGC